jgi:hypothetical protein
MSTIVIIESHKLWEERHAWLFEHGFKWDQDETGRRSKRPIKLIFSGQDYYHYQFTDPQLAMLFKLTFA